jgi:hypothetical protein
LVWLRKIDAAMEQNEDGEKQKGRLIDAKAEIEQALTKLPEGELKNEISLGLEAYVTRMRVLEEVEKTKGRYALMNRITGKNTPVPDNPQVILYDYEPDNPAFRDLLKKRYTTNFHEGRGYAPNASVKDPPTLPFTTFDGKELLTATLEAGRAHVSRASSLLQL